MASSLIRCAAGLYLRTGFIAFACDPVYGCFHALHRAILESFTRTKHTRHKSLPAGPSVFAAQGTFRAELSAGHGHLLARDHAYTATPVTNYVTKAATTEQNP